MNERISRPVETISVDLETRSALDLKKSGAYRYAMDPGTGVWCVAWCFGEQEIRVWEPGEAVPKMITSHAKSGGIFCAWNAQFERLIWQYVLVPKYGWPELKLNQWRCTQAEALAYGLPASLEEAAKALGLEARKDTQGKNLMLRMSKPRREDESGLVWWDEPERVDRLKDYCLQDVRVECAISCEIPRLSNREHQIWLLDQCVNDRGVCLDRDLVRSAIKVVEQAQKSANEKLHRFTGGQVCSVTNASALKLWLHERGFACDSVAKEAVNQLLKEDLPEDVRFVLKLRAENALSSTAKLGTMLNACCPDGRLRGLLKYCGAATGRWSGKLVQPQNFPRGMPVLNIDQAIETVMQQDAKLVDICHGPPVEVVSSLLRSMLVSAKGNELVAADYSSIEARVLAWLAREKSLVKAFELGEDVYRLMASLIYCIDVNQVTKTQRQVGKMAVLGCGYSMGPERFREQCTQSGILIDQVQAGFIVRSYRESNVKITRLWKKMEAAAIETVRIGDSCSCADGKIQFEMKDKALRMILPSGRALHYHHPRTIDAETPWGETTPALLHHGVNTITRRWGEQRTYGGRLVENAVQAIARDLLAEAIIRLELKGWEIVLSVHDELVAECKEMKADLDDFTRLMASVPKWAIGCPIAADGWVSKRYRK